MVKATGGERDRTWSPRSQLLSFCAAGYAVIVLVAAVLDVALAIAVAVPAAAIAPSAALWLVRNDPSDVRLPWKLIVVGLNIAVLTQIFWLVEATPLIQRAAAVTTFSAYACIVLGLMAIERLRGANGLVVGVDAALAALAALLVAWRLGIDNDMPIGAMWGPSLWLAFALAASVLMTRLLITGLGGLAAIPLLALGLMASLISEAMWFLQSVEILPRSDVPTLLHLVAVLLAFAGIAHPSRLRLVSPLSVSRSRRLSSLPFAGPIAGLVAVVALGIAEPMGRVDQLVSSTLAGSIVFGVSVQVLVRDRMLRRVNDQLAVRVEYDDLTGLLNRNGIRFRLDAALEVVRRGDGSLGVAFIDLDRFSVVNDGLGHDIGDEVLLTIGARLARSLDDRAAVGRLGGDEFLVVLPGATDDVMAAVAAQLLGAVSTPIVSSAGPVRVSASAGYLVVDAGADVALADTIRSADLAMYQAKRDGRSRVARFDGQLADSIERRHDIEQALRERLARHDGLELHYQPIVDPVSGRLRGFEALSRWTDPRLGAVSPDEFVPVAEEAGLICELSRWALSEALGELHRWQEERGQQDLWVSVNVSGRDLRDPRFVDDVAKILAASCVAPDTLTLELTESSLIEHGAADGDALAALRALGVNLAVDDFGTGYSSLAYLARMPVTTVKIDRSFVEGLSSVGSPGRPVVEAVVQLARSFGLSVVAEGVEEAAQAVRLAELGVDQAQGWLWSPALPADDAFALVSDYSPASPTTEDTVETFPAASTHDAVSSNDEAHMNSVEPRVR